MKTCATSFHWPACASLPHPPRRVAASTRLCEACCYTPPVPYAASHGASQA